MKDVPENELFSAYLDGELTAEEQAEVDRLLTRSPSARQLMDELRAISANLQTLPAHQLGEDLGEQVLRAAEKRMLCEPVVPRELGQRATASIPSTAERTLKSIVRRIIAPRNLFWPAVAVAVFVILTLNQSNDHQQPAERQLAATPEQSHSPEKAPSEAAKPVAGTTEIKQARPVKSPRRTVVTKRTGTAAAAARTRVEKPGRSLAARMKSGPGVGKDADADKRVVVRCNVTGRAAEEGLLEKLLAKHGIAEDTSAEKSPPAGEGKDTRRTLRVTADARKIKAVLDELKSKPTEFSAVSVEPAEVKFSDEYSTENMPTYRVTFELHIVKPADAE